MVLTQDQVWHRLVGNPEDWEPCLDLNSQCPLTGHDLFCLARHLFAKLCQQCGILYFQAHSVPSTTDLIVINCSSGWYLNGKKSATCPPELQFNDIAARYSYVQLTLVHV